MILESWNDLAEHICAYGNTLDAIIVEGYDGVGKGRILSMLSDGLLVAPYRPDYNLWQNHHKLCQEDRWKISGFFWDVYSHFTRDRKIYGNLMLFDRGVISGAVYNNDGSIALDYKKILRDSKVLHILIVCDKEDYINLLKVRLPNIGNTECEKLWSEYLVYEERYKYYLELSGVDYVIYKNKFDPDIAKTLSYTCEGCGHYSYGICRHPSMNCNVDKSNERCLLSFEKEVQDNI